MKSWGRRWGALIGCMLLGILFSMSCILTVQADIIWEPEDTFYNGHASECTYVNRVFIANGPDGVVIVYKNPESPQVVTRWENGFQTYISYTYQDSDGILWGIYENTKSGETGWMPMEYMEVVYDGISFAEEFGAEIVTQDGTLDDRYLGQEVYFWKYPGALEGTSIQTQDYLPTYYEVFVDEVGRSWGNTGYYFGLKNEWVCIDQPTADFDMLYPDGAPQRGKAQTEQDEHIAAESTAEQEAESEQELSKESKEARIVPRHNNMTVIVTVILVLAVVLITVVLLAVLKRKV